jgi:hypothetical protein
VAADDRTGERVDDRPGLRAEPALQEAGGVAVGDEADVVAVRLVGDPEPAAAACSRTCALVSSPRGRTVPASCSA